MSDISGNDIGENFAGWSFREKDPALVYAVIPDD
jgi:hypothetical protein